MIKHIVMWKLKDHGNGNTKEQNAAIIKEKLELLPSKISGILKLEVGIDFSKTESSGDLVLYSEFATKQDLDNYLAHPDHKSVMPFINEARTERFVVDYIS